MYYEEEVQVGWLCPRCGKINAPWMPFCDCDQEEVEEKEKDTKPLYRFVGDELYDKLP